MELKCCSSASLRSLGPSSWLDEAGGIPCCRGSDIDVLITDKKVAMSVGWCKIGYPMMKPAPLGLVVSLKNALRCRQF